MSNRRSFLQKAGHVCAGAMAGTAMAGTAMALAGHAAEAVILGGGTGWEPAH